MNKQHIHIPQNATIFTQHKSSKFDTLIKHATQLVYFFFNDQRTVYHTTCVITISQNSLFNFLFKISIIRTSPPVKYSNIDHKTETKRG